MVKKYLFLLLCLLLVALPLLSQDESFKSEQAQVLLQSLVDDLQASLSDIKALKFQLKISKESQATSIEVIQSLENSLLIEKEKLANYESLSKELTEQSEKLSQALDQSKSELLECLTQLEELKIYLKTIENQRDLFTGLAIGGTILGFIAGALIF